MFALSFVKMTGIAIFTAKSKAPGVADRGEGLLQQWYVLRKLYHIYII